MANKPQPTIVHFINQLQALLDANHGTTPGLRQRLTTLQIAIRASNTTSNDPAVEQMAENLNPAGAAAVADILGSLSLQRNHDSIDLQTADRIVRSYLDTTDWVETIKIGPKGDRDAVRVARAELRGQLNLMARQGQVPLELLVQESITLAAQPNPVLSDIIDHLELAVDTLKQTRDDRDLIDPRITRQLAVNWSKILANAEGNIVPASTIDLQRVADLLTIRQLIEEASDLLTEDISADSPLDLVNI